MSKKTYIPEVDKGVLLKLSKRIKPLVLDARGTLSHIKPVDIFHVAYTWDARPTTKASDDLATLKDITPYHRYGYYGMFKPSIAEVLAQIPKRYLDKTVAFEIIWSPSTSADFNVDRAAFNAGYHVAKTRLYKKGS